MHSVSIRGIRNYVFGHAHIDISCPARIRVTHARVSSHGRIRDDTVGHAQIHIFFPGRIDHVTSGHAGSRISSLCRICDDTPGHSHIDISPQNPFTKFL